MRIVPIVRLARDAHRAQYAPSTVIHTARILSSDFDFGCCSNIQKIPECTAIGDFDFLGKVRVGEIAGAGNLSRVGLQLSDE